MVATASRLLALIVTLMLCLEPLSAYAIEEVTDTDSGTDIELVREPTTDDVIEVVEGEPATDGLDAKTEAPPAPTPAPARRGAAGPQVTAIADPNPPDLGSLATQAIDEDAFADEVRRGIIELIGRDASEGVMLAHPVPEADFNWLYPHVIGQSPLLMRQVNFNHYSIYTADNAGTTYVTRFIPFFYEGMATQTRVDALEEATTELMRWVPGNGSDVEKAKAVHDWLARNVTYDYDTADNVNPTWYARDPYGALVERSGVCDAYAKTFKLMMDYLRIPCTYVSAHDHAWNRILIGSSWYHVDATWADDYPWDPTSLTAYFLKSDQKVQATDLADYGEVTHADYDGYGFEVPGTDTRYDDLVDADWPDYNGPLALNDVTSLSLTKTTITLAPFDEFDLAPYLTVGPTSANPSVIRWTSSNEGVACVLRDRRVYAGAEQGTATITGTYGTCSCQLTVIVSEGGSTPQQRTDLSGATVTVSGSYAYDGSPHRPKPTVTLGGRTLVEGTDYTLSYQNNTEAGTATVLATGKGGYEGRASGTFAIAKGRPQVTVSPLTIGVGQRAFLNAQVTPDGLALDFRSSNAGIATVSAGGYVTGVGTGTATVTISCAASANTVATSTTTQVTVVSQMQPCGPTISDVRLFGLDGSSSTLAGRFGGTRRIIVVGSPESRYTADIVADLSRMAADAAYDSVNLLVLDVDGDRAAFEEEFADFEGSRLHLFSPTTSGDVAYDQWAWDEYEKYHPDVTSISLPFVFVADETDSLVMATSGSVNVFALAQDLFGITDPHPRTGTIRVTDVGKLESDHDYPTGADLTYTYTDPTAVGRTMTLTFDDRSRLEANYDFLEVTDDFGTRETFTGQELAGATVSLMGPTVHLHLTSDRDVSYWGFKVTNIQLSGGSYRDGWQNLPGGHKGYARGGSLVTGWLDLDGRKYWFDGSGRMALGWTDVLVNGNLMHYYFNPASGNLARGTWMDIDGKKYYFRPSGNVAHGFETIADGGVDKKYYFDDDYQMVTGWRDVEVGGKVMHYYFRPSGAMATGWATIDGYQYWFRASGNLATGWADVDDAYKRYFDESGHMVTGWQTIGGKRYYFRASGAMQTGAAWIDGKRYTFSGSGVLVS